MKNYSDIEKISTKYNWNDPSLTQKNGKKNRYVAVNYILKSYFITYTACYAGGSEGNLNRPFLFGSGHVQYFSRCEFKHFERSKIGITTWTHNSEQPVFNIVIQTPAASIKIN
jgi:hypothetical protein